MHLIRGVQDPSVFGMCGVSLAHELGGALLDWVQDFLGGDGAGRGSCHEIHISDCMFGLLGDIGDGISRFRCRV